MRGQRRTRSGATDRQVEERLALLLRPGPRHARVEAARRPGAPRAGGGPVAGADDHRAPPSARSHRVHEPHGGEASVGMPVLEGGIIPRSFDADVEAPATDPGQQLSEVAEPGSAEPMDREASPTVAAPEAVRPRPPGAIAQWRARTAGRFERPQLIVVVAIVLVGLALSGWAVLRARPVEIAGAVAGAHQPARPTGVLTAGQSAGVPSTASGSTPPVELIKVHVLGAVRKPGVIELPAESRIEDALEEAGGIKASAELGDLNLAQRLTDGQQVYIGRDPDKTEVREPGVGSSAAGGSGGSAGGSSSKPSVGGSAGSVVDLNTATAEDLDQLPGVGPVTAEKILAWREQNGRFTAVEELQEIDGIGPKTYAELAPLVTV